MHSLGCSKWHVIDKLFHLSQWIKNAKFQAVLVAVAVALQTSDPFVELEVGFEFGSSLTVHSQIAKNCCFGLQWCQVEGSWYWIE